MNREELYHFGIMGQKWGIRRYQNEDGSLTEEGRKRYLNSSGEWDKKSSKKYAKDMRRFEKDDTKFVRKKGKQIYDETYKKTRPEIQKFVQELDKVMPRYNSDGKSLSRNYVNHYNQKLAELMNQNMSDIETPSGKTIRYVAKRASDGVGVYTAIASKNYDMSKVKNGVYGDTGRIGYRKTSVDVQNEEPKRR